VGRGKRSSEGRKGLSLFEGGDIVAQGEKDVEVGRDGRGILYSQQFGKEKTRATVARRLKKGRLNNNT